MPAQNFLTFLLPVLFCSTPAMVTFSPPLSIYKFSLLPSFPGISSHFWISDMGFYQRFVFFLLVALMGFLGSSIIAHKFYVGGKEGWVMYPSEDYNHWAARNRFQVNDTLIFKYNYGTDSVLVVKKEDYLLCDTRNPIVSLTEGNSIFKTDRPGPFFFISGHQECCQKGEKLHIVVMAERHEHVVAPRLPSPPLLPSPQAELPPAESPSGFEAPAPTPTNNSALRCTRGYVGLVLGIGVVSLFL